MGTQKNCLTERALLNTLKTHVKLFYSTTVCLTGPNIKDWIFCFSGFLIFRTFFCQGPAVFNMFKRYNMGQFMSFRYLLSSADSLCCSNTCAGISGRARRVNSCQSPDLHISKICVREI